MNIDGFPRRGIAGRIGIAALAAAALAACVWAPAATAGTGGAGGPGSAPTVKGSPSGTPTGEPSAGVLSLLSARTTPRRSFYFGYRYPHLVYTISSTQPQNDLRIDVIDREGEAIRTFYREDVAPNVTNRVRWDGTTDAGRPARNGRYSFRILPQAPGPAPRRAPTSPPLKLGFNLYGYAFPVVGGHEFGLGAGRFGAGRSGHTHQGQDVMASCGQTLIAARGGRVQYSGYQGAAGNYIVIDGRGTPDDFLYAHMAEPSSLKEGEVLRTGQPIGIVGDSGDATACHLHFEIWAAPGWYEGGSPFDPLPYLQHWDRYS